MDWLTLAWSTLIAASLLWIPGLALGWLAGLRGLPLYAVAPAFGATALVAASTIAPLIGVPWTILPLLGAAGVLGVVIALLRRLVRVRDAYRVARSDTGWVTLLAIVIALIVLSWRVGQVIGIPEAFSQTFDNVFHMNAVRFILDTANGSSLSVGLLTSPPGGQGFYPAAWHAWVALVVQLTGASIPLAINAATIVVSALVWPAGVLLLTRVWFGTGSAITISAGVLAAATPQFPLLLMHYGVLYPLQFGLSLVPAALALASTMLGAVRGAQPLPPRWAAILLAGTLPGIAVAHPGAFVALLALSAPIVLLWFVRRFRETSGGRRFGLVGGLAAYLIAGVLLVKILRPPADARGWPPIDSISHAATDVLSLGAYIAEPALVVAALAILGLVVALRRHSRGDLAAAGVWLVAATLYVVVAACQIWPIRDVLTGSWYNNIPRLAALLPIAATPLAAVGAAALWSFLSSRLRTRPVVGATVAAVGVVALLVATQLGAMTAATRVAHEETFALTADSPLVDPDELALIKRLADTVPDGAVIAGSPWTGVAVAYALSGRHVLMPHMLMYETDEIREINADLRSAGDSSDVCDALRDLSVSYVLDFGAREVHGAQHDYPGLDRLTTSSAVELVDQQGHAKLYRITACG